MLALIAVTFSQLTNHSGGGAGLIPTHPACTTTETAMEKLILLVSEYFCLYQMELHNTIILKKKYNNIVMKNNAWRNISFAMRLPYYFSGYSIS